MLYIDQRMPLVATACIQTLAQPTLRRSLAGVARVGCRTSPTILPTIGRVRRARCNILYVNRCSVGLQMYGRLIIRKQAMIGEYYTGRNLCWENSCRRQFTNSGRLLARGRRKRLDSKSSAGMTCTTQHRTPAHGDPLRPGSRHLTVSKGFRGENDSVIHGTPVSIPLGPAEGGVGLIVWLHKPCVLGLMHRT
jgi:hypothetical protein